MDNQEAPFIEFDDDAAERFVISAEETSVGRNSDNDLCIPDPEISRHHARFLRRDDGIALEDLGSSNGTFVNDSRISGVVLLRDGDRLGIAGVQATFHDGQPELSPQEPSTSAGSPPQHAAQQLPQAALEGIGIPPILLEAEETCLGRALDNEVVLEDPAVSSHHAAIRRHAGDFTLVDVGSVNGTYVNGVQLTATHVLQPGDEIRLGDTLVVFRRLTPYRRGGLRGSDRG